MEHEELVHKLKLKGITFDDATFLENVKDKIGFTYDEIYNLIVPNDSNDNAKKFSRRLIFLMNYLTPALKEFMLSIGFNKNKIKEIFYSDRFKPFLNFIRDQLQNKMAVLKNDFGINEGKILIILGLANGYNNLGVLINLLDDENVYEYLKTEPYKSDFSNLFNTYNFNNPRMFFLDFFVRMVTRYHKDITPREFTSLCNLSNKFLSEDLRAETDAVGNNLAKLKLLLARADRLPLLTEMPEKQKPVDYWRQSLAAASMEAQQFTGPRPPSVTSTTTHQSPVSFPHGAHGYNVTEVDLAVGYQKRQEQMNKRKAEVAKQVAKRRKAALSSDVDLTAVEAPIPASPLPDNQKQPAEVAQPFLSTEEVADYFSKIPTGQEPAATQERVSATGSTHHSDQLSQLSREDVEDFFNSQAQSQTPAPISLGAYGTQAPQALRAYRTPAPQPAGAYGTQMPYSTWNYRTYAPYTAGAYGTHESQPAGAYGMYEGQPAGAYGTHGAQPAGAYGTHGAQPAGAYGTHGAQPAGAYGTHGGQPAGAYGTHGGQPAGAYGTTAPTTRPIGAHANSLFHYRPPRLEGSNSILREIDKQIQIQMSLSRNLNPNVDADTYTEVLTLISNQLQLLQEAKASTHDSRRVIGLLNRFVNNLEVQASYYLVTGDDVETFKQFLRDLPPAGPRPF